MVRVYRLLIILGMTAVALGREPLELSCRGTLVTRFAIDCGVRAYQWKSVLVLANLLQ